MARYAMLSEHDRDMFFTEVDRLLTNNFEGANFSMDYTRGVLDVLSTIGLLKDWNEWVEINYPED